MYWGGPASTGIVVFILFVLVSITDRSLESIFVTYAFLPSGAMPTASGFLPTLIVPSTVGVVGWWQQVGTLSLGSRILRRALAGAGPFP